MGFVFGDEYVSFYFKTHIIKIALILSASILSIAIAYFHYFYRVQNKYSYRWLLFSLRSIALFLLLLLLINPTIEKIEYTIEKPKLSVLIDNSSSIDYFNQNNEVIQLKNKFQNSQLSSKFDVIYYKIEKVITPLDSLTFDGVQTNIYNSLKTIDKINSENHRTILISDGNQTTGRDYEFASTKSAVYPIIIGDTAQIQDIEVSQINVNKYSYLKNKFPVEIVLKYKGNSRIRKQFTIAKKGQTIYRENIDFNENNSSKILTVNLESESKGFQLYKASIQQLTDEKNTINNSKTFGVEVIDEQSNIALITSINHPDIGALKRAIETNQQRSLKVFYDIEDTKELQNYQLTILYQPNFEFSSIIETLKRESLNYLLITGSNTDWNLINSMEMGVNKNYITQNENYLAEYNPNFFTYQQDDIGFDDFPPLIDAFGEVLFTQDHEVLLFQNIEGFSSGIPLLATMNSGDQKSGFLLGENLWKWRSSSYLKTNSTQNFDLFINNLIQFLTATKKRNRLEVEAGKVFKSNEPVVFSAFYVDENYAFDSRANLILNLINKETDEKSSFPFSLKVNSFESIVEDLEPGSYSFTVNVSGSDISKSGEFEVLTYQIEQQFTNANKSKMELLAQNTGGHVYYPAQFTVLESLLLQDQSLQSIQSSNTTQISLVDWKLILIIIVAILSVEWFIRKYFGLI